MLKYSDLTKAQARFVDAILAEDPTIAETGTATRKQIESLYWTLAAKRENGGEKVGFPNWLTGPNKISRGLYQIPMPSQVSASAPTPAKKKEELERSKLEKIIDDSITDDSYDEETDDIVSSYASAADFE